MRNTTTAGRREAAGITTVAGFACALGCAVLVAGCANNRHSRTEPTIWPALSSASRAQLGMGAASPAASLSSAPSPLPHAPATTAAKKPSPTWDPPAAPTIRGSALAPPPNNAPPVTITNTGNLAKDRHTMRIVSAKGDLTGQHDMWMAAGGFPSGDATCTQTFHMTVGAPPQVRNTMLICYRFSETRSVYTIAVDLDKPPSPADSVTVIDSTWNTLRTK